MAEIPKPLQKVAQKVGETEFGKSFTKRWRELGILSYGLQVALESYFHPYSLNNPNVRNALYEKYASHVKVTLPDEFSRMSFEIIGGPYVVEPVGDSGAAYMGALGEGALALEHAISLRNGHRENSLKIVTRELNQVKLPNYLEILKQAALPTKDHPSPTKKDPNRVRKKFTHWIYEDKMKAHLRNGGSVLVFPTGKAHVDYGMSKKGIINQTAYVALQANFGGKQKLGLAYAAFTSSGSGYDRRMDEVQVGVIKVPVLHPDVNTAHKELIQDVATLMTEYAFTKIAETIDGKVLSEQKGQFPNPETEKDRVITDLHQKLASISNYVLDWGFVGEEWQKLQLVMQ